VEESEIGRVFHIYYSNLFTTSQPFDIKGILDVVQPKVLGEMNHMLTKEFHACEVSQSLKQMYATKSLGRDGTPPFFYQQFWTTIGNCVTRTVSYFLNHGKVPPKFNDTHIS